LGKEHGGNHFEDFVLIQQVTKTFRRILLYILPSSQLTSEAVGDSCLGMVMLYRREGALKAGHVIHVSHTLDVHTQLSAPYAELTHGTVRMRHLNVCFKTDRPTSERNRTLHRKMISTKSDCYAARNVKC
jgi:hypothetical protein